MKVTRIKENAWLLSKVGDMFQRGVVSNTPDAIVCIGTVLGDISKSLAIIADAMSESVGDDDANE